MTPLSVASLLERDDASDGSRSMSLSRSAATEIDAASPALALLREAELLSRHPGVNQDLGNLTMVDSRPMPGVSAASNAKPMTASAALTAATEAVQSLVLSLFTLPSSTPTNTASSGSSARSTLVLLPVPTSKVPRRLRAPEGAGLGGDPNKTKWEEYAQAKGILKRKRNRMVFDEELEEWRPRYGPNAAARSRMTDWVIEGKNSDVDRLLEEEDWDPFLQAKREKKERVEKNRAQQEANTRRRVAATASKGALEGALDGEAVSRSDDVTMTAAAYAHSASKTALPSLGSGQSARAFKKKTLERAFDTVQRSTASIGKFDQRVHGEGAVKGIREKRAPLHGDTNAERASQLRLLERTSQLGKTKESSYGLSVAGIDKTRASKKLGRNMQAKVQSEEAHARSTATANRRRSKKGGRR
jgi:regulator of ribosome biosynthesis